MPKFPLRSLVEVEWSDICTSNTGWQSMESAKHDAQLMDIRTVGYVLEDTSKILKLCMMQAPTNDGEVGVTAVIPKSVIKKSKVLSGLK